MQTIAINSAGFGSTQTSSGGNGEMPAGMYVFDYQVFSPLGLVTLTPSMAGVMNFSPSARSVSADQGASGIDFSVPSSSPPPPPPNNPPPPPPAPTYTISGVVIDVNGNPLSNVQVWGGPTLGNTYTAADGSYSFSNVPENTYLGFAPVYSPHAFTPQSAVFPNGTTSNITQNFIGAPLYGPPILSLHPLDQTVNQHYTATFRTQVINSYAGNTTYQWYKNGQPVSGATSNIYSFYAQKSDDGASIQCFISNDYGSVWTQVAVLDVNTTPDILTEPLDITVESGKPASFSVQASGGPLNYIWLTGNYNWPNVNSNMLIVTPTLEADGTVTFASGNLFAPNLPVSNQVSLWVYISNQYGGTLSREVILTVC